jgi:hypothetical protein
MANTYQLIANATASGSQNTISFTSIPSTYTDLLLRASLRSNSAVTYDTIYLILNGSTSSFQFKTIQGNGSAATSYGNSNNTIGDIDGANNTANTFSLLDLYLPNYLASNNKSYSVDFAHEQNGTTAYLELEAGLWSNTAAITSLGVQLYGSLTFTTNSTFYLYGIKNS